jgi:hypothetical protein
MTTFVARFVAANGRTHEVECRDGVIVDQRDEHTSASLPVLEFALPRLFDDDAVHTMPFVEDPYLHRDALIGAGADVRRMFPLSVTGRREPQEFLPDFRMLWIMRDGPFGDFAWRNVYVDGRCDANDAVAISDTDDTPWDIIIEADFVDCIDFFLGEIEARDLLARAQVQGGVFALSTLTWFVERDEMLARASEHRATAQLLREWVTIARSDETLARVHAHSSSIATPPVSRAVTG